MATFFVVIVSVATIALILLVAKFNRKKSKTVDGLHKVTIEQGKNSIRLNATDECPINLSIAKSKRYFRFLEKFKLFKVEKTGDEDFDSLFQITIYREDVLNILRTNTTLRRLIIQLANDVPSFSSLIYSEGKISLALTIGKLSKGEAQESARKEFETLFEKLVLPFKKLPANTRKESLSRKIDLYAPYFPFLTMFILTILGISIDKPLATSEIPWKYVFEAIVFLVIVQFTILVLATKRGTVRAEGLYIATFAFAFGAFNLVPKMVQELNAISERQVVSETVEIADLYMYRPSKGASHYYIQLATKPEILAAGQIKNGPAVEISYDIYSVLEHDHLQPHSLIKISEALGLLGLPFVVNAVPL